MMLFLSIWLWYSQSPVVAGMLIASATGSLVQDFIGKDAWIAAANECWIDWRVTVPVAVIGLLQAWHLLNDGRLLP